MKIFCHFKAEKVPKCEPIKKESSKRECEKLLAQTLQAKNVGIPYSVSDLLQIVCSFCVIIG